MRVNPEDPSTRATGSPPRADVHELARARHAIAAAAHPDARTVLDTALGTLHAALAGGGLQASSIPGLRNTVRKHVRQAWMDGILAPLARSRRPVDRAALDALPKSFPLDAHERALAVVDGVARQVADDPGGAREHVARAGAYLRALPVVLQALDDLETLVPVGVPNGRPRSNAEAPGADDPAIRAERRLKDALSRSLPELVRDLTRLVDPVPSGAAGAPSLRHVTDALAAPSPHGRRPLNAAGTQRRRSLLVALSRDLADEGLMPAARRLLHRHAGLEVGAATFARAGDTGGRLSLGLSRGQVRILLGVDFDVATGRRRPSCDLVTANGDRVPVDIDGVEARLDASIPDALDTAAHRAMRRLSRRDGATDLRMHVAETGELHVSPGADRRWDAASLGEVAAVADEEDSPVRFDAGRDLLLASALVELGFEWREDAAGRGLVRVPDAPAYGGP